MNISPTEMIKLLDLGLTTEQLRGVLDVLQSKPDRSSSAARMARKRERDRNSGITQRHSDVTCDAVVTLNGDASLSPLVPPSLSPTPPNSPPYNPPKPVRPTKNSEPESFPAFWEAYPNKTGKPKALEAYRKALRKTTAEQILSGLSAAKRHDNRFRDRQFTPMPATWLNNDGWSDEHDAPASVAASSPNDHTAGWTEQRWRLSVDLAVQNGRWEPKWGPPPDDPKTLCPINLRPLWKKAA